MQYHLFSEREIRDTDTQTSIRAKRALFFNCVLLCSFIPSTRTLEYTQQYKQTKKKHPGHIASKPDVLTTESAAMQLSNSIRPARTSYFSSIVQHAPAYPCNNLKPLLFGAFPPQYRNSKHNNHETHPQGYLEEKKSYKS